MVVLVLYRYACNTLTRKKLFYTNAPNPDNFRRGEENISPMQRRFLRRTILRPKNCFFQKVHARTTPFDSR